jgi:glucan-binding YG repeat protein
MLTGWQRIDGSWYYLGGADSGRMASGWQMVGAYWYYLGSANSGRMVTGWQSWNGYWYYLTPVSGHMATGSLTIDGVLYHFRGGDDGRLL